MKFKGEVTPATAQRIEATAAKQGIAPEAYLAMETQPQHGTIPDEQFRASMEKIFADYLRAFEALAQSERDDRRKS